LSCTSGEVTPAASQSPAFRWLWNEHSSSSNTSERCTLSVERSTFSNTYRAGPSALELLVHEHQRSRTQSGAFMAETINYAAMHNPVVLVGHRSANGAVHTSVGRSPTITAISTSFSSIQGLKARTITALFSCISCVSWLAQCPSKPIRPDFSSE